MQYAVQRIIVAWVWWSFVASASPQNASTCILLPLSIKHVEHYTTQGIDAGFEAYSATHGVCTFHGSARVVKQPTASCDHVIHDTVWDAHDVDDVVDDAALSIASYLALDIDCPTNDVAVHGWILPLHPPPLRKGYRVLQATRPPDNFTSDTGQQCCCSAPPYPVCCCGPNRYTCCVPFTQGPCGTLCKSLVIVLSLMVVVVSMAAVITWRVYQRRREEHMAGSASADGNGIRQTPSAILRELEMCTSKGSAPAAEDAFASTKPSSTTTTAVSTKTAASTNTDVDQPSVVTWDAPDMTTVPLDNDSLSCGEDAACPVCLDAPTHGVEWRRFRCGHGVCFTCLKQMSMRLASAQQATCPICRAPLMSSFAPTTPGGAATHVEQAAAPHTTPSMAPSSATASTTSVQHGHNTHYDY